MSFDPLNKKMDKKIELKSNLPHHLPPQAIELEEAVLGAMLLEKNAVHEVIDILTPKSFYKESHQQIFETMLSLFQNSEPIDLYTLQAALKKRGILEKIGGAYYLANLTQHVTSAAHAEHYARIIAQKHIQRELIRVSSNILKDAFEDTTDVFDLLDKAEQELFSVSETNIRKSYDRMEDILHQSFLQIEEARKNKDGISGIPTGFKKLDELTAGFHPGQMIVIASRPAMGKTAFILSMARNVAIEAQKAVAVFSLEMDALELVNRLISAESEIESSKIKKGTLSDEEVERMYQKTDKLGKAKIFIDDTPGLNIFELRAKCRRLKARHDIQMVIIDYLQLMSSSSNGGNREQEISAISRSIKSIAKELGIPFIALSQLSRAVETRGGDKRPQLSDLRESGAIEQDADMVFFLYRPEYYGIEADENNQSTKGMAEIIVAKHRGGGLENIKMRFIGAFTKFTNWEDTPTSFGFNAQTTNTRKKSDFEKDTSKNNFSPNDNDPFGIEMEIPF